jgi:hypothetical protein
MVRRLTFTLVAALIALTAAAPAVSADPLRGDECILKPVWC